MSLSGPVQQERDGFGPPGASGGASVLVTAQLGLQDAGLGRRTHRVPASRGLGARTEPGRLTGGASGA